MHNQRASVFSTHSHSNASLFYQRRLMSKRPKNRVQTSPVNFFQLLQVQAIDKQILLLLKQYLFRRRATVLFSAAIIVLISLNTLFLTVHLYDCRTFDLCSINDEESKPFFFWILIGLNLTLTTVLVFVVLHLKHCKQFYARNLLRLTVKALQPGRTSSEETSLASAAGHANRQTFHLSNSPQPGRPHRKLPNNCPDFDVPSISVVHFDAHTRVDLNKSTCYDNLTFEPDLGIEMSERAQPFAAKAS